jgi:hypothetical protein
LPASTSVISFTGGTASLPSIRPTATQMSRPDGVGELDRAHRHAERERRFVDGFGRMPSSTQRIAVIR